MKSMRLLVLLLLLSVAMLATDTSTPQASPVNLMPWPAQITVQSGRLPLDRQFYVAVIGRQNPRLTMAIQRLQQRIEGRTGVTLPLGIVGGSTQGADSDLAKLKVQYINDGPEYPALGEDESYSLEITAQGAALKANTLLGAYRGLETIFQLVAADRDGYYLPLMKIEDRPRFPWRGLMVDVARHFQPVDVVKRNIDGLAAVKMNVFHWHLTDDQGFRVESKRYPKLQEMGSDGLYYTQEQVREVVAYAAARGVRVVPEFDMPGHTTSWFVGYPELASGPGPYQIQREFGIFDPVMDPTREETYKFLDGFLGEMAELFPDEYMHIGGDENNGKQWRANPKIQDFMRKHNLQDTAALQAYFVQRVVKIVQKHGKKVIGWDEVLTPELPKNVMVQFWRGTNTVATGIRDGYDGILSQPYYYDHMAPSDHLYLQDPIPPESQLTPEEEKHMLGGEACAWAEFLVPENIDSRLWPRNAAVAERFWSPRDVRNVADMYRRLDPVSIGLEQDGLTHESSTAKMLRQVAGTREIAPLLELARVAQPEGVAIREHAPRDNQLTPLVRMTDAAVPDPPFRRQFAAMVDQLMNDAPHFSAASAQLTAVFQEWTTLAPAYQPFEIIAPILRDTDARVQQLGQLGNAGLEALKYLQSGNTPPAGWKETQLALIDNAEKPDKVSVLKFSWLGSYRTLVLAAAGIGELKNSSPQQWKQSVESQSAQQEPQPKYTW